MAALRILLFCLALTVPTLAFASQPQTIATFSVAAYDPNTGEVGVAVQSKFFAVGSVVPWCKAGVGAVATQAFGQPEYGRRGLDLMADNNNPTMTLLRLLGELNGDPDNTPVDSKASARQLGIVSVTGTEPTGGSAETGSDKDTPLYDRIESHGKPFGNYRWTATRSGQATTYTGIDCLDWAGGRTGRTLDGVVYAVQGNILTGPEVVDAMASAMENPAQIVLPGAYQNGQVGIALNSHDFAGRLLGALVAGQIAGGDSRGMQSAALKVSQAGAGYGGYNDVKYDLRVDDATDPFMELARLLNLARPITLANQAYLLLNDNKMDQAIALFQQLVELQPNDANHRYNLACGLARAGRNDEAMEQLTRALELDPKMKEPAKTDTDLTSLRERDDFQKLVVTP